MFGAEVPEWVLGACICLFGSTLTALGLVLQKHSHTVSALSGQDEARYYLRKWWLCGFVVFLSAQIINMVAMAMTPQVVLSCLGSWTLVCNAAFAHLILRESLSSMQVMAVLGLVIAMATVIYNAPRPPTGQPPPGGGDAEKLARRFLSPEVEICSTCALGLICLTRSLALGLDPVRRAQLHLQRHQQQGPLAAVGNGKGGRDGLLQLSGQADGAGAGAAAGTVQKGLERLELPNGAVPKRSEGARGRQMLAPLSWATMAAVSAGYTTLLFKCIAEIIAGAVVQPKVSLPPWYCWETYMIGGVALSCAPTELHCLNLALQCGEAVFVIPMYLTLAMMAQLVTGAVFFQEFNNFRSKAHALGFALGVLLTVIFVIAMAKAQDDHCQSLEVDCPDMHIKLVPEPVEPQEPARPQRPDAFTSETQSVSVAGFGGAIECLSLEANRTRGRSDYGRVYRYRHTIRPVSVGGRTLLTAADRSTSSPV